MSGTFVITAPYAGSGGIATLTPLENVSVTVESFLGVVPIPDEIPATGGTSNEVWAILKNNKHITLFEFSSPEEVLSTKQQIEAWLRLNNYVLEASPQ